MLIVLYCVFSFPAPSASQQVYTFNIQHKESRHKESLTTTNQQQLSLMAKYSSHHYQTLLLLSFLALYLHGATCSRLLLAAKSKQYIEQYTGTIKCPGGIEGKVTSSEDPHKIFDVIVEWEALWGVIKCTDWAVYDCTKGGPSCSMDDDKSGSDCKMGGLPETIRMKPTLNRCYQVSAEGCSGELCP
jgi:hypothetical protein